MNRTFVSKPDDFCGQVIADSTPRHVGLLARGPDSAAVVLLDYDEVLRLYHFLGDVLMARGS